MSESQIENSKAEIKEEAKVKKTNEAYTPVDYQETADGLGVSSNYKV